METEQSALLSASTTASAPTIGSRILAALAALRRPSVLLATLALLLLGWQWLETRSRLTDLQQELAKRLAEGDAIANESRTLAKQNQEMLQALAAKTGSLETKLIEAQGQQLALESMYQELSKSRDERVLADIEQAVSNAAQQLQLTGNVEGVLITLQGVDARLARTGQARLLPLRKLINRDIDRLKALPLADVPGIALRLENVIGAVDNLPLAFEQRPRVEPVAKVKSNTSVNGKPGNTKSHAAAENNFWQDLGRDLWAELKQLIRVVRIDHPEPALLAPTQVFFLRENLKLRLIDARLALLQRDGRIYREDLRQARDLLERYFDTREKSVSNAIAMLKDLSSVDLSLGLPTFDATLNSIRNFKLARENDAPPVTSRQGSKGGGGAAR
ncbi:MAG: uroporphyrinogen-III C-methyltransferase [Betaproteobacteria bacterium]|nr:uroporphyrinogen-III C-methyltransferase [Betaproteobacteria bacterium]